MIVYHGDTLKEFISDSLDSGLKERFIMKYLDKYITSGNDRMLFCLYGLHNTGKTVMMMQEVRKIRDYENCLWLTCQSGDIMRDVGEAMTDYLRYKYIFIDNITETKDFIRMSSFLSNAYAYGGIKIVISGADSLSFLFAEMDALFDRMHLLHTTYISFPEYHDLLGKDIMHYIRYGGTLAPEKDFASTEALNCYINDSIVRNAENSIRRWDNSFYPAKRIMEQYDLSELINEILENNCIESASPFINMEASHSVDEKSTKVFSDYLRRMDVLFPMGFGHLCRQKNKLIFTQSGMRYGLALALAKRTKPLPEHLESSIYEGVLKENVLQHVIRTIQTFPRENTEHMSVYPYRNKSGNRIDVLIDDYEKKFTIALEVSLSENRNEDQLRNLQNAELCQEIERKTGVPIINKVVVYRGETATSGDVLYLNLEEFLVNTAEWIVRLSRQHPEG